MSLQDGEMAQQLKVKFSFQDPYGQAHGCL